MVLEWCSISGDWSRWQRLRIMEKIFTPNKWFVLFCGVLVIVWIVLQVVATLHLQALAREQAVQIFSWQWLGFARSHALIEDAQLIKRSDTDAVVRVTAREMIVPDSAIVRMPKLSAVHCAALLTFYRVDKNWLLAKVEFE